MRIRRSSWPRVSYGSDEVSIECDALRMNPLIGITGASGLIGSHVRSHFLASGVRNLKIANRETFEDFEQLCEFVRGCQTIIHLAGMNRGDKAEIAVTNPRLARDLVRALESEGSGANIVYSNSTHQNLETPYGISKRTVAEILGEWSSRSGAHFSDIVFPNVFGEGGRPFANSVVSTFCHQLVRGVEPAVINDNEIELLHAGAASEMIIQSALNSSDGTQRPVGTNITVSTLLENLKDLNSHYKDGWIPATQSDFERSLFNTFRSFRFEVSPIINLQRHSDARGAFVELVKCEQGGQTSFSTTVPGVTRGNHFHLRKMERFVVVSGVGNIRLRKLFTDKVFEFAVSGGDSIAVDMPTMFTHSITNSSSDPLITAFWIDEMYDESDPDTYSEPVLQ